ncbi:hypothetical protein WN944_015015 [Citrus x changshan-huyou]|uniref:Phytocyanin domain-containing protein n=1 Tax=Citrus x changshan-huyou TaxID=2935761 RepID=A0AAP0QQN4_9ROSI
MMPRWAVKAILLTVIISTPFSGVSATNHTVGGPTGWDLSSNIQAWSATATFHVGDTLVFTYTPLHDVLEVNQLEYATCHTVKPISAHNSGDTVVPLIEPGNRYFICGRNGHCASGLKFRVDVLPQLDANVTRRTPRSPHRSPPSPPLRHPPPPPPPTNSSSDGKEPDIPSDPGFDSPGPCGNSAVGDMITDWFSYSWWVPLATTLLVSLDFPGFSFA